MVFRAEPLRTLTALCRKGSASEQNPFARRKEKRAVEMGDWGRGRERHMTATGYRNDPDHHEQMFSHVLGCSIYSQMYFHLPPGVYELCFTRYIHTICRVCGFFRGRPISNVFCLFRLLLFLTHAFCHPASFRPPAGVPDLLHGSVHGLPGPPGEALRLQPSPGGEDAPSSRRTSSDAAGEATAVVLWRVGWSIIYRIPTLLVGGLWTLLETIETEVVVDSLSRRRP